MKKMTNKEMLMELKKVKPMYDKLISIAHKIVVNTFDYSCYSVNDLIEDLSIKDIQSENKHVMNRVIGDLAWNMFTNMLTYKAECKGKNIIKIGQYVPSSKTCSNCGYVKHDLQLIDREWDCLECG